MKILSIFVAFLENINLITNSSFVQTISIEIPINYEILIIAKLWFSYKNILGWVECCDELYDK